MKITIQRQQLMAALQTAGDQDIRYYLNGVLVEADATQTRLIATNGHCMSIQRYVTEQAYVPEADATDARPAQDGVTIPTSFIIPRDIVKMVKASRMELLWLIGDGNAWTLSDPANGLSVNFTPIDGKFPDYHRVIQDKVSGEVAQFDPQYIAAFSKASKILGNKIGMVTIGHNGSFGATVSIPGHEYAYIGIFMPMKGDAPLAASSSHFARDRILDVQVAK